MARSQHLANVYNSSNFNYSIVIVDLTIIGGGPAGMTAQRLNIWNVSAISS
jgi:ribulose 1,5-bisphosphate synthetase/thiazole synthase